MLYPIGIPALYLLLLFCARGAILRDRPTRLSSALSFLHRDFEAAHKQPNPSPHPVPMPKPKPDSPCPEPNPNPNPNPNPKPQTPFPNQARMYGWEIAEQFKKLFLVGFMVEP